MAGRRGAGSRAGPRRVFELRGVMWAERGFGSWLPLTSSFLVLETSKMGWEDFWLVGVMERRGLMQCATPQCHVRSASTTSPAHSTPPPLVSVPARTPSCRGVSSSRKPLQSPQPGSGHARLTWTSLLAQPWVVGACPSHLPFLAHQAPSSRQPPGPVGGWGSEVCRRCWWGTGDTLTHHGSQILQENPCAAGSILLSPLPAAGVGQVCWEVQEENLS